MIIKGISFYFDVSMFLIFVIIPQMIGIILFFTVSAAVHSSLVCHCSLSFPKLRLRVGWAVIVFRYASYLIVAFGKIGRTHPLFASRAFCSILPSAKIVIAICLDSISRIASAFDIFVDDVLGALFVFSDELPLHS